MKAGRPTDYKPEYCKQAEKLCKLGMIDKELAGFFDIAESTLNNWKHEYPEFFEAIKEGREIADAEVADSLYRRALGSDKHTPDTIAAIFWLKNRRRQDWREKHEVVVTNFEPIIIMDENGKKMMELTSRERGPRQEQMAE